MQVSTRPIAVAVEAVERRIEAEMFRARRDAALLALARARTFAVAGERLTLGQIATIMREEFGTKWAAHHINCRIKEAKAASRNRKP